MKTNVILNSVDRILFDVVIKQSTKDQLLSVTDLGKAFERARWQYGWGERGVNTVMQTHDFRERCYHLLFERGLIKVGINTFMEMVLNDGIVKVLKGLGLWKTSGRASDKAVFCDPFIWMLLAMELNPMIYAKVVIWLTDTLILDRVDAGGEYLPMNSAIKKAIGNPDYTKYAKAINIRVFGMHQAGMRNIASAKELRKIANIEMFVTNAVEQGWINTEEKILKAIHNYS